MERLIGAENLLNGIALYMAENAYLNDTPLGVLKMVANWITDATTVDAVEVVRCKDCKFGVTPYGDEHDGWIECSNIHSRPLFGCNDFCSYGERKGGDGNG